MKTFNAIDLYDHHMGEEVDGEVGQQIDELKGNGVIRIVLAACEMSANRIGGDDVVSIVDEVLSAVKDGYTVSTFYGFGDMAEVLIVGIKSDMVGDVEVVDE